MCHHNSFLIYDSLMEPTEKRWATVTHISVLVAMICTLVLGVTGYATFTGYSQGISVVFFEDVNFWLLSIGKTHNRY